MITFFENYLNLLLNSELTVFYWLIPYFIILFVIHIFSTKNIIPITHDNTLNKYIMIYSLIPILVWVPALYMLLELLNPLNLNNIKTEI